MLTNPPINEVSILQSKLEIFTKLSFWVTYLRKMQICTRAQLVKIIAVKGLFLEVLRLLFKLSYPPSSGITAFHVNQRTTTAASL